MSSVASLSDEDWEAISDNFSVLSINSFMLIDVDTFTYKEILLKPCVAPSNQQNSESSHKRNVPCEPTNNETQKETGAIQLLEEDGTNAWHEITAPRYHKHRSGHTFRKHSMQRDFPGQNRDQDTAKVIDRDNVPANIRIPDGHKGDRKWQKHGKRQERYQQRYECRKMIKK